MKEKDATQQHSGIIKLITRLQALAAKLIAAKRIVYTRLPVFAGAIYQEAKKRQKKHQRKLTRWYHTTTPIFNSSLTQVKQACLYQTNHVIKQIRILSNTTIDVLISHSWLPLSCVLVFFFVYTGVGQHSNARPSKLTQAQQYRNAFPLSAAAHARMSQAYFASGLQQPAQQSLRTAQVVNAIYNTGKITWFDSEVSQAQANLDTLAQKRARLTQLQTKLYRYPYSWQLLMQTAKTAQELNQPQLARSYIATAKWLNPSEETRVLD